MTRPPSVAFPSPVHAQPGAFFPSHLPEAVFSTLKYYGAIWATSWILFPKITAFWLTKQQLTSELFLFYIMPVETLKSIPISFVKKWAKPGPLQAYGVTFVYRSVPKLAIWLNLLFSFPKKILFSYIHSKDSSSDTSTTLGRPGLEKLEAKLMKPK